MIKIPTRIKLGAKKVGYFAYQDDGEVICDGDACIIAGSIERMKFYLSKVSEVLGSGEVIKKTLFGEIIEGMRHGGAYAFDEEAYQIFIKYAKKNGIIGLPEAEAVFLDISEEMHFIRIQITT